MMFLSTNTMAIELLSTRTMANNVAKHTKTIIEEGAKQKNNANEAAK